MNTVTETTSLPRTMAAILTPYDDAGRLDPARWADYIPWLEDHGVDGHFLFGTTGEGITLTVAERQEGLEALVRIARKPVVVHVGAMNATDTRRLLAHAEEVGAAGAAIVSPAYYTHDADALVQYFAALAWGCQIPLLLYNIPSHAASDVTPAIAARICAEAAPYVGIKDSSRQPGRPALYRAAGLRVWVGAESLIQANTLLGEGSITAIAAAFPAEVAALVRDAASPAGAERQARLIALHARLGTPTIQVLRESVRLQGFDLGPPRLPFRALTADEQSRVAAVLADVTARSAS